MRRNIAAFAAFAALVVASSLTSWTPARAGVGGGLDARAQRSELLLRIAELTDQLESSHAAIVAAQLDQARLAESAARVQARVKARAVRAYIHGKGFALSEAGSPELAAPAAYLEVTARKDRELWARFRAALRAAESREADADALRSSLRALGAELETARAELDQMIAAEETRRLAQQRAAEEAAAQRAAEEARARAQAEAARASVEERVAKPDMTPRHRKATAAQQELFRKYPFGILPSTGPLPGGLRFTGEQSTGLASWYGGMFNGRPTASGAIYDQELWTAASRTLPLGTLVVVSRRGTRVLLLINDRGPYIDGRIIDLSAIAARALDVGVSEVTVEVVEPAS